MTSDSSICRADFQPFRHGRDSVIDERTSYASDFRSGTQAKVNALRARSSGAARVKIQNAFLTSDDRNAPPPPLAQTRSFIQDGPPESPGSSLLRKDRHARQDPALLSQRGLASSIVKAARGDQPDGNNFGQCDSTDGLLVCVILISACVTVQDRDGFRSNMQQQPIAQLISLLRVDRHFENAATS